MRHRPKLDELGCLVVACLVAVYPPLGIVAIHFLRHVPEDEEWRGVGIGWTCLAIYGCAATLNFYLSLVRPWLHQRRGDGQYKHVSGIPVVHSIFLWIAIVALPPSFFTGALMLLLLALDSGAPHWFALVVAMEVLRKRQATSRTRSKHVRRS